MQKDNKIVCFSINAWVCYSELQKKLMNEH